MSKDVTVVSERKEEEAIHGDGVLSPERYREFCNYLQKHKEQEGKTLADDVCGQFGITLDRPVIYIQEGTALRMDGSYLSHFAAQKGCALLVAYILSIHPGQVSILGNFRKNLLHFALQDAHIPVVKQCCDVLLDKGKKWKKEALWALDENGELPIQEATKNTNTAMEAIGLMVALDPSLLGAKVAKGKKAVIAHFVVVYGHLPFIKTLKGLYTQHKGSESKAEGGEVTWEAFMVAVTDAGDTPLHLALQNGKPDTAQYLLTSSRKALKIANGAGFFPIHRAVTKGYTEIVKNMLTIFPSLLWKEITTGEWRGATIVHLAADGHLDIMEEIKGDYIKPGADRDIWDKQLCKKMAGGCTPLLLACASKQDHAVRGFLLEEPAITSTLRIADKYGTLPIHWAIHSNDEETVGKMLALDPSLQKQRITQGNYAGDTPLHLALRSVNPTMAAYLLKQPGIKEALWVPDKHGVFPIHVVAHHGNMVLLQAMRELDPFLLWAEEQHGEGRNLNLRYNVLYQLTLSKHYDNLFILLEEPYVRERLWQDDVTVKAMIRELWFQDQIAYLVLFMAWLPESIREGITQWEGGFPNREYQKKYTALQFAWEPLKKDVRCLHHYALPLLHASKKYSRLSGLPMEAQGRILLQHCRLLKYAPPTPKGMEEKKGVPGALPKERDKFAILPDFLGRIAHVLLLKQLEREGTQLVVGGMERKEEKEGKGEGEGAVRVEVSNGQRQERKQSIDSEGERKAIMSSREEEVFRGLEDKHFETKGMRDGHLSEVAEHLTVACLNLLPKSLVELYKEFLERECGPIKDCIQKELSSLLPDDTYTVEKPLRAYIIRQVTDQLILTMIDNKKPLKTYITEGVKEAVRLYQEDIALQGWKKGIAHAAWLKEAAVEIVSEVDHDRSGEQGVFHKRPIYRRRLHRECVFAIAEVEGYQGLFQEGNAGQGEYKVPSEVLTAYVKEGIGEPYRQHKRRKNESKEAKESWLKGPMRRCLEAVQQPAWKRGVDVYVGELVEAVSTAYHRRTGEAMDSGVRHHLASMWRDILKENAFQSIFTGNNPVLQARQDVLVEPLLQQWGVSKRELWDEGIQKDAYRKIFTTTLLEEGKSHVGRFLQQQTVRDLGVTA